MAENKLIIGNIEITGIQNITAGNQELSTSLLNDVLEIDTLDCDFNSEDSSLNILSCIGEKVTYYHGDQQRQILYVESIKRTGPKSYHIYAVSAVSKLDTIPHSGGIYTGQTALEVISEICGPIPVIVKSNLRNIQLYGWLPYCQPPNSSARDNLNQVLFAIGASLGTDLNGVLRIETLWDGTTGAIELQRTDLNGSVTDVQKVSIVSVTEHQYTEGQEEQDLFEGTAQEGDTIVFNEPMHTLTASGFTILESGANYAKLSAGSGILTGKKYIHNKRVIARTVTENIPENEKSKENATLVSLINSNAIADRLARYYKCNKTIQSSFITEYERPGQIVNIMDPYDQEIVSACIASMNVNMSGVLKADAELLVGFVPPKASAEYYDTMELIDEDTTWTVPDGVTSLRVVLIGGGSGGSGGAPGEDGGRGIFGTKGRGKGGSGGVKGEAGAGGKIYQNNITVSPGNAFQVHIGNGGTGGNGGEAPTNGSDGGDTTFGELSSLNGSRSENGFYEQTSGITYAKPGEAGIPGGNGDGANSTAENVIYKGVTYTPGDTVRGETYEGYVASGGGGGGASAGENGKDGTIGRVSTQPYATGGDGGDGGTPVNGENATIYGFGGSGGHGGGGGGGGGNCTGAEDRYTWEGAGGSGGMGSNGGNGYKGCVILYYSAPKLTASGPVMDRTGRFILDKLGRRFVV